MPEYLSTWTQWAAILVDFRLRLRLIRTVWNRDRMEVDEYLEICQFTTAGTSTSQRRQRRIMRQRCSKPAHLFCSKCNWGRFRRNKWPIFYLCFTIQCVELMTYMFVTKWRLQIRWAALTYGIEKVMWKRILLSRYVIRDYCVGLLLLSGFINSPAITTISGCRAESTEWDPHKLATGTSRIELDICITRHCLWTLLRQWKSSVLQHQFLFKRTSIPWHRRHVYPLWGVPRELVAFSWSSKSMFAQFILNFMNQTGMCLRKIGVLIQLYMSFHTSNVIIPSASSSSAPLDDLQSLEDLLHKQEILALRSACKYKI